MTIAAPLRPRADLDRGFAVVAGILGVALFAGIVGSWLIATAVLVLGLLLMVRPFDPFALMVSAAAVAGFVNNEAGHLTRELAVLVSLGFGGLVCLTLAALQGRWGVPRSRLLLVLLVFETWTLISAFRGIAAGNSLRYLGLELLPLGALTIAVLVGGLRLSSRDLQFAFVVLNLASLGHVALGLASYAINHVRTGGIWYTPFPGMMALLLFNVLVRDDRRGSRFGMTLLLGANLLHQLISLTRGYWMGLVAGFALSCLLYVGRRAGARQRALRVLVVFAWLGLMLVAALAVVGSYFGWGDVASLFGARLTSSFGTQQSSETASNVARLVEWLAATRDIAAAPWFGYGLGYVLHIRYPIVVQVSSQWFVHEHYLWMWLKQGLLGLALLLLVLGVGLQTGIQCARRLSGAAAGWCAGSAAATAYIAVLGLTNFPLAEVNPTVLLALLWGVALSLGRPARWRVVWRLLSTPLTAAS